MSTPSLAAQARLAELLPLAIAEGWDVPRLAKAANVGKHAANVALRERVGQIVAASEKSGAGLLQRMQVEAALERPAVLARLKAAGECADALLSKVREMIETLPADDVDDDEVTEEEEKQPQGGALKRRRASITLEQRVTSLATAVKAATAASRECWETFKDASGLAFAEDAARMALKTTGKGKPALVPDVIIELLPDGER